MPQWRRSKRLWDKKIEKATRFKKDEEPKLESASSFLLLILPFSLNVSCLNLRKSPNLLP